MDLTDGRKKKKKSGDEMKALPASAKPAIDNKPLPFDEPLDYTYMNLEMLSECLDVSPRPRIEEKMPLKSARKDATEDEINARVPTKTNAVRFSNNNLSDEFWDEMESTIPKIVEDSKKVEWVDLSFNCITTIDQRLPQMFPNCKVLYLHGNNIAKMSDVKKLSKFKKLRSVTLHGNPLTEIGGSGYRYETISMLPSSLKSLDFSGVSKTDHMVAEFNPFPKARKKKKKKEDD